MYRKAIWTMLVALPLAISGWVYAGSQPSADVNTANAEGFVCPITGEELPCDNCCPLK